MIKTDTQFKEYKGRSIDQMPIMLAEGVVPLSVVGFMLNREAIVEQLGSIYAGTSDLAAYGREGTSSELKMFLTVDNQGRITENGRKALELINPLQERSSGAIVLTNEVYNEFNGVGVVPLFRKELKKYGVDKNLTEAQVLNHLGLRVLLRHPDAVPAEFAYDGLMQEVVGKTFAEMGKRHDYIEGMGFYLDASEKNAKLRAWCVDGLADRSDAGGRYYLDAGSGRFVSIAPEAPNAPTETKSESPQTVKLYTTADLQAFDKAMEGLEGIICSDALKPFVNLRNKL